MAEVVEDGTGVTGANSYISGAEIDAFHTCRNNITWEDADQEVRTAGKIEAAEYLDATYRWAGTISTEAQGLGWPRSGAFDHEGRPLSGVPQRVKDAASILALEFVASGALLPSQERGGAIKRRMEKVDVIEQEIEYFEGAPGHRSFPLIDRLLAGLIVGQVAGLTAQLRRT